jgi:uncharacterized protein YcbK (DUF882 family)
MSSPPQTEPAGFSRRRLLRAFALAVFPAQAAETGERRLILANTHTGETLDTVYWSGGRMRPESLGRLDWIFRDHRASSVLPIDTRLYDLLHELAAAASVPPRYQIISGYRSPATNAMLSARGGGVSSSSLHMQGRAIDVRLEGIPTARLRDLALERRRGGVGYYAGSDFVHLDVGRVRSWAG